MKLSNFGEPHLEQRGSGRYSSFAALGAALLMILAGAAGCTASATASTTTSGGCQVDSSVNCSSGTGWSCSGDSQPEDVNTDLVCSTDGTGDFCCASSSCSYDSSVTGCTGGSVGYSCASGAAAPDSSDSTLVCSIPTSAGSQDDYCCFTNTTTASSTSTCSEDPSVMGCESDSFGFSCTGSENPDSDFSNVNCSTTGTSGMDANGNPATLYCCTVQ
jgi:hypothetical protein